MKKILLLFLLGYAFNMHAQSYSFSKSTGTYSNITGATVLENGNWQMIQKVIKLPFVFKVWGVNIVDSIYIDDFGSISINDNYDQEIGFLIEDLTSRGAGKSLISYKIEGSSPSRIFKLEYQNIGFDGDLPGLKDSANAQCWLYETSNIIEFRYGPNKVKSTTWADGGAFTGLVNAAGTKFIILQGNPANPTVNTTNMATATALTGMAASGTIYKFTPPASGVTKPNVKINVIANKIAIPASVEVKSIHIYNSIGQMVQSAANADAIDLSKLIGGVYFIQVETNEGIISEKVMI